MFFLEIPLPDHSELGDCLTKHFHENGLFLSVAELVRSHQVYFQNKPVPFLPFKIYKKGKAQVYLDVPSYSLKKEDIIYEDKWLIAINKPSGLASQSTLKFLQEHAYSSVICYLRDQRPKTSPPLYLLHRLDMDTSGVLLFSKKSSANKNIQKAFESRNIKKTYFALSQTDEEKAPDPVIKSYITRAPDKTHAFKFKSVDTPSKYAKYAETKVESCTTSENLKLIKLAPQTGRSHQLRVHLKDQNHAILGDPFYGNVKESHLFLHARHLELKHPITQDPLKLTAPFPPHWAEYLDKFESYLISY